MANSQSQVQSNNTVADLVGCKGTPLLAKVGNITIKIDYYEHFNNTSLQDSQKLHKSSKLLFSRLLFSLSHIPDRWEGKFSHQSSAGSGRDLNISVRHAHLHTWGLPFQKS